MDWIDLPEDGDRLWALLNALLNLQVPKIPVTFLTSWDLVSFPGRTLLCGVNSDWLCSYNWWFVTDECFKFGSGSVFIFPLCGNNELNWIFCVHPWCHMVHGVPLHYTILKYLCAMFVCWGVRWNMALLEGQQCVRKKRYRYWSTRCDEQLLACHLVTDGWTDIVLLLEWPGRV